MSAFFFPPLNYHADSFCCIRTSLSTSWTWAEPLTPCLAGLHSGPAQASAPLQRQSWQSQSWWAVLSFFRTSSLFPIYFQPVIFLPQTEQIVLFPRCKTVPSSSPTFFELNRSLDSFFTKARHCQLSCIQQCHVRTHQETSCLCLYQRVLGSHGLSNHFELPHKGKMLPAA